MSSVIEILPKVLCLPATHEPLSADVFAVQGENSWWIFDVGASDEAVEFINSLPSEINGRAMRKNIVISHFHGDHLYNLQRALQGKIKVLYHDIFVGANTYKYIRTGHVVSNSLIIEDGLQMQILPMPNSHAKGSLAFLIGCELALLGDATYPQVRPERDAYNVQLLGDEIRMLQNLDVRYFALSHKKSVIREKSSVIAYLEGVYSKRKKENSLIELDF